MRKSKPVPKAKAKGYRAKPSLKKPAKRNRNAYARALETATKKYDKAVSELGRAEDKVERLLLELPRLAQVKQSLEAYINGDVMPAAAPVKVRKPTREYDPEANAPPLPELGERKPSGPLPASAMAAVPGYLAHMIKEHPAIERGSVGAARGMVQNVNVDPANEDGFLPDPDGIALIDD